jgi:hypothetical protein
MVRLTRLRIDRFRNVKPGTELRFGPTFNVLLGKNATGKSTLLDLIAAVTNDDLSAYADEDAGFDLTWWIDEEDNQIEVHAARTPASSGVLPEHVREAKALKEFDDRWTMRLLTGGTEAGQSEVVGTRGIWRPSDAPEVEFDVRAGLAAGRATWRSCISVLINHNFVGGKLATRTEGPTSGIEAALELLIGEGLVGRFDEALRCFDAVTRVSFALGRRGASITVRPHAPP